MDRPRPTKKIINEMCGGNVGLLAATHHGLVETPLKFLYPSLDLKEVVGFAASSWKGRYLQDPMIGWKSQVESLYDLFNYVFKIGMPWVNKHENVSAANMDVYDKLNPFGATGLRERLDSYEGHALDAAFVKRLLQPAREYVSEAQYRRMKRDRDGRFDSGLVEVMTFQPSSMKGKNTAVADRYSAEISRILRDYPAEIKSLS